MIHSAEKIAERLYKENGFAKDSLAPLRVLHLGCGIHKIPDAVGIDRIAFPVVDVVHDLEQFPWPFADNSFDVIVAHAVLEHVPDVVRTMEEIHRVGSSGGRFICSVPYFRSVDSANDPTHAHQFTAASMDYFLGDNNARAQYCYTPRRFNKVAFWFGWPRQSSNPLKRLFRRFITRHARWYDQYLSLIAPVRVLTWELAIEK